jgi:hypothetical protein
MSEPLIVKLPHKLGKEEALRRVKPALGKPLPFFAPHRHKRKR